MLMYKPLIRLSGLILLIQGWLLWMNYPYYFTYYNPLLGGAEGAAQLMTVGWGEGLNEVGAFLNAQPNAEHLQVAVCGYKRALNPFFVGDSPGYEAQTSTVMEADYLVFYLPALQRQLCGTAWSYFSQHAQPVKRVTLQGVDYALVYRNPITQRVHWQASGSANKLTVLGYNLVSNGQLIVFWQKMNSAQGQLLAGLTPALSYKTAWTTCFLTPTFTPDAGTSTAILESTCSLTPTSALSTTYELYLGWKAGNNIVTLTPTEPALVSIDSAGHFVPIELKAVLSSLAAGQLPPQAVPLDIFFDDKVRVAGYQLNSHSRSASDQVEVILYFQLLQPLEPSLLETFQLVLLMSLPDAKQPGLEVAFPVFPSSLVSVEIKPGKLIPVPYSFSIPKTLPPGGYTLEACLTVAVNHQKISCLPLGFVRFKVK